MLGGLQPVIIFQFGKLLPSTAANLESRIPILSEAKTYLDYPPIPIYLDDGFTGIFIDTEDKNVDIETDVETATDGSTPLTNQKGVSSTVKINFTAKRDSVGLILLSSLIDVLFDKATSAEYSITYLHGATTIFRGVLHNFSVNQTADNDKLIGTIELSRGGKQPQKPADVPQVPGVTGALPIT